MTVIAPPKSPPPEHDPLEALIEEARRRARRRRLVAALAILAGAIAGGVWAGLALFGGSGSGAAVKPPPGFVVMKSKGSVAHALIQYEPRGWATTNLATLTDRPVKVTEEVWYDPESGLWRDIYRVDGRKRSDLAGTFCSTSRGRRECFAPPPFSGLESFRPWPPEQAGYVATTGTFHGREVIWLTTRHPVPKGQTAMRIGLDPQTHRTLVQQTFARKRMLGELVISQRKDLSGYSFVVPKGGATVSTPPYEPAGGLTLGYGLPEARKELGRPPLWLGPRFREYVLRSVTVGTYSVKTRAGRVQAAPFVHFYYAGEVGKQWAVWVEEFGPTRPYFYERGPRPGYLERDGSSIVRLTRNGLILRITSDFRFPLTRANALAIAKALRPLPPNLRSLPTLHEQ